MKKLLLPLLLLTGFIGFGQSVGRLRYDTVVIEKVGGSAELIIKNKTRDTSGYLFNAGGGRAIWKTVPASTGGSGGFFGKTDTLQTQAGSYNQAGYTTVIKNGTFAFGYKDSIGYLFNHDWNNAITTTFTNALSTTTSTIAAGGNTFAGGGKNLSNYIEFPARSGFNNNTTVVTLVAGTKSSTSYGFGLERHTTSGLIEIFAHYLMADTNSYVAFTGTSGYPTATALNSKLQSTFYYNTGDTIQAGVTQRHADVVSWIKNLSNGSYASVKSTQTSILNGNWRLYFYGGSWKLIGNYTSRIDEAKNPQILVGGNSIAFNLYSDGYDNSWSNLMSNGISGGVVNIAGPGETILEAILHQNDIYQAQSQYYLMCDGTNDFTGTLIDSFAKRYYRLGAQVKAWGITPIAVSIDPRSTNVQVWNDTIQAIATRLGIPYFNTNKALVAQTGTALNPLYAALDNLHLSQLGHKAKAQAMLNEFRSHGISLTMMSPVKVAGLPYDRFPYRYIGRNYSGEEVEIPTGSDRGYIRNLYAYRNDGTLAIPDSGNITIKGDIQVSGFLDALGVNDNKSSPGWRFDPITSVSTGKGLHVGVTTLTGGEMDLLGGKIFRQSATQDEAYQNPFKFFRSSTGTGEQATAIFDNDNTAGGMYRINDWRFNGARVASLGKTGALYLKDTANYSNNFGSIYGPRSLTDKNYVDSAIAANVSGGGSGVTTMLTFGTSPNANGATISGVNLTLQPADATNPGGISTTTQTIAGAKTFSSLVNTTANKYSASGTQVLYYPSTFTNTIFLGTGGAAISHTTGNEGYYNTVLGVASGISMTTASFNVGVGSRVFTGTMTGTANVAMGDAAMVSATIAASNTAIGNQSMLGITTGANNTAVGATTLGANLIGGANTAFGFQVLPSATGSDNTSFGTQSGVNITTGAGNTIVGRTAGGGITTGGNNAVFGDNIGSLAAGQSGTVVIGANALRRIWVNSSGKMILGNSITNTDTTYRGADVTANGTFKIENIPAASQSSRDSMRVTENGLDKFVRGDQTLAVNTTDVGNVGTGEDDMMTYIIPAATLSTNNDRIEFEGVYQFTGANSKTIKVYFGAQLLTTVGPGTPVAFFNIKGTIIRTGATTQKASVTMVSSSTTYQYNVDISTPAETLSGTVILKSTGTATADNDIVQKSFIVKFYPAP